MFKICSLVLLYFGFFHTLSTCNRSTQSCVFRKVDERAVLKHFDWPEGKADALRDAAFEYQDLVKLQQQVASFDDDPKFPCDPALKKMYKLLEKYAFSSHTCLCELVSVFSAF